MALRNKLLKCPFCESRVLLKKIDDHAKNLCANRRKYPAGHRTCPHEGCYERLAVGFDFDSHIKMCEHNPDRHHNYTDNGGQGGPPTAGGDVERKDWLKPEPEDQSKPVFWHNNYGDPAAYQSSMSGNYQIWKTERQDDWQRSNHADYGMYGHQRDGPYQHTEGHYHNRQQWDNSDWRRHKHDRYDNRQRGRGHIGPDRYERVGRGEGRGEPYDYYQWLKDRSKYMKQRRGQLPEDVRARHDMLRRNDEYREVEREVVATQSEGAAWDGRHEPDLKFLDHVEQDLAKLPPDQQEAPQEATEQVRPRRRNDPRFNLSRQRAHRE